jgi:hypothetical protein
MIRPNDNQKHSHGERRVDEEIAGKLGVTARFAQNRTLSKTPMDFMRFHKRTVGHDFRNHTVPGSSFLHKRLSKFPSKAIVIRITC